MEKFKAVRDRYWPLFWRRSSTFRKFILLHIPRDLFRIFYPLYFHLNKFLLHLHITHKFLITKFQLASITVSSWAIFTSAIFWLRNRQKSKWLFILLDIYNIILIVGYFIEFLIIRVKFKMNLLICELGAEEINLSRRYWFSWVVAVGWLYFVRQEYFMISLRIFPFQHLPNIESSIVIILFRILYRRALFDILAARVRSRVSN